MKRGMNFLVIAVASLMLAACAGSISTDVARFHQIGRAGGQTVRIVPADPEKTGSLEFETYAGYVRQRLIEQGYRPVAEDPDVLVELDYGVSDPRTRIRADTHNVGFAGGFYGGPFFFRNGITAFPSTSTHVRSYDVYDRRVSLDMIEAVSGDVIFEGRLRSLGVNPDLPEVMPYLVEALFVDFPGENGRTERVVVELSEGRD